MRKGSIELSYGTLIIIVVAIVVAVVVISLAVMIYKSPATSGSFACDFICSVKEGMSTWLSGPLKIFIPKISSCGC
ncbi:MAG: hypothetical protein J7L45_00335 [Candidatus Aenigmarchaeota archaeon]|nr:hypothetical protein [Candidatus Aenigmarchaeota archaeon]